MKLTELRQLISGYNADNTLRGTSKFTKQKIVNILTLKFQLVNGSLVLKAATPGKVNVLKAPVIPQALQKALDKKKAGDRSAMASRIKDKLKSVNSKTGAKNPTSAWVEHVKNYARVHNVPYGKAMSLAKSSY